MYLQPYNNPRAGLYNLRKHHNSTLNLAVSSINTETNSQQASGELSSIRPGRLLKARSLDILSDAWSPAHQDRETTGETVERSMSRVSQFSFSSEFSSSSKEEHQSESSSPDIRFSYQQFSSMDSESAASLVSKDGEKSFSPPSVPPRPKAEEILTRCCTMTRKAALATKTRLQIQQPESSHMR